MSSRERIERLDKLTKSYNKKSNKSLVTAWFLRKRLDKDELLILSNTMRQRQVRFGGLEL
jgi:hypothetical protein